MSTNQDVQTLEETLERTDLGHIINENKKLVGIVAGLIVAALIGYVVFAKVQNSREMELLDKAYDVEKTIFIPFQDGKMKSDEFISKFNSIDKQLYTAGNLYPGLLESLNKLKSEGKLTTEIMTTAQAWIDSLDKRSRLYLLAGLSVGGMWEDLGEFDKALGIYENLVKRSSDLLKDQIFFNVGRMYIKKGDKTSAQKYFDFIFKEYEDTQYAKLARLYLSEI